MIIIKFIGVFNLKKFVSIIVIILVVVVGLLFVGVFNVNVDLIYIVKSGDFVWVIV